MNSWTRSLKGILTISFVLTVTVPIVVISFFTVQLLNHSLISEITEKNQLVADSLAAETGQFLTHAGQVISQVADEVDEMGLKDQELVEHYLITVVRNFPYFNSVRIVDEQGVVIMMAPVNPDYVGNNISGSAFYQKLQDSKQFGWSAVFISSITGQPTISFGRPLQHGMIIGNLNLSSLNQIVSRMDNFADGWAGITDVEGTYIGHTIAQRVNERTNVRQVDFVQKALRGEVGSYRYNNNDREFMVNVAVVPAIGWPVIVAQDANTALAPVHATRNILTAGALIGLLLAVVIAIWLLVRILAPIVNLVNSIRAVAAGNYQEWKYPSSYTEFAVIAQNFDAMAEAVASRERELRDKQQELEVSMGEVQSSNRELAQFAYVTSHDLKAPLRAIANLSQWLEDDLVECLDDSARKKLHLLRGRVRRMENLIAGILEYSRIGRVKSALQWVDTSELLAEILEDLEIPAEFTISIGEGMPIVQADRVRLNQVFANLIDNAVKHHNRPNGNIGITVNEHENFYEFTVADDGPGIEASLHEKVFEIFQTLKPRDQFESTGVGLALVKKIVEQQGGAVGLISEQGQGARFVFTWPKEEKTSLSKP
jgi:signal transduction histidine kinase